jgi:sulfotransferase
LGVLKSVLNGYYDYSSKPVVVDKDMRWISMIGLLESILERPIKMIICVRNPAEILSSFEKLRKENPLFFIRADASLKESSSIASRAYFYSNPDGLLGSAHRSIKDAVIMGYLDRLLFVDYGKYCSTPKSQTKRIYDFLELPNYEHNFENIVQEEQFNSIHPGMPNLLKIRPELVKSTLNCVEYLGLDLYEQYNREIFWNAWI